MHLWKIRRKFQLSESYVITKTHSLQAVNNAISEKEYGAPWSVEYIGEIDEFEEGYYAKDLTKDD